jgi:hypothetical protein
MRSCLLSPKFFNVVNKVLASTVSSDMYHSQLRLTIIQFLNKIMKLDRDFIPLVLSEINLVKFLKYNLLDGDNSAIHIIVEFLQNF